MNKQANSIGVEGFMFLRSIVQWRVKKYQTLMDNYDARKFGRRSNYSNINKKIILPKWEISDG